MVWRENAYYPSPEMHEDAAERLLAFLRAELGLWSGGSGPGP